MGGGSTPPSLYIGPPPNRGGQYKRSGCGGAARGGYWAKFTLKGYYVRQPFRVSEPLKGMGTK
jgi:hypothetical protein